MINESKSSSKQSFNITADMIKKVREETRAGALDCKQALEATSGDIEQAIKHLIENGKCTPKTIWL